MLDLNFDCHLHTTRSACGEDITDLWLCAKAHEDQVCFAVTDHTMHLYYEPEIAWALYRADNVELFEARRVQGRDNILRYLEDLRSCHSPNQLVGVELDVLPNGQIMLADDLREELDLLVAAVHFLPSTERKAPQSEVSAEYRQQVTWLLEYGVQVLAHPFRTLLSAGYEADAELVAWTVEIAGQYGVALEVNSHKVFPDHDRQMVALAAKRGVGLAVGTDAHNSREFGEFGYHRQIFAQSGVSEARVAELLYRPAACPAL
jgi:histidinol phosphatase-like PHP family hydrolase